MWRPQGGRKNAAGASQRKAVAVTAAAAAGYVALSGSANPAAWVALPGGATSAALQPSGAVDSLSAARYAGVEESPASGLSGAAPLCSVCGIAAAGAVASVASRRRMQQRGGRTQLAAAVVADRSRKMRPVPEGMKDGPPGFEDQVWFTMRLSRPFGFRLAEDEKGPGYGVGICEMGEEGTAPARLREFLEGKGAPVWVQEGDALVLVDGAPTEGALDTALELIAQSGEEVDLTFGRHKRGLVKVVFPGGKHVTARRKQKLSILAEEIGYDCGCTCRDGRCGKCWHKDSLTGELYILPLNACGVIPSAWRAAGEDGLKQGEGLHESYCPILLEPAPEMFRKEMDRRAKQAKLRSMSAAEALEYQKAEKKKTEAEAKMKAQEAWESAQSIAEESVKQETK
eukprot:TRINITY_DN90214_c0_g1_i1.p1 TRINITY_DN90214_c0_g1~~TRINITY_DN90214_c0_g1_i1.p1  ORF type:complete len:399 (+),score=118.63 TRINITY_DN90214_c0_g1_i1:85-1281(+)